jgi:hypothetical protein
MDHAHFDTLARRVFTDLRQSRRAALATLVGVTLLRHDVGMTLAKKQAKATTAAADACFPGGTTCRPGRGTNASRCDFAHSTLFTHKDVRGANLSNSNFFAADLRGADFRGANLSGSCFVGADLTGAKLGSSVNLHDAIFCHTTMPDGRIDNSGCAGETPCCHQRLQSCPDAEIGCYVPFSDGGICKTLVGTFGPVGHCYHFPSCCPCDHADFAYWTAQCNASFPACNGQCVANDGEVVGIRCFQGCLG